MIGGLLKTTSLAAVAAVTVAFTGSMTPAKAADLGGNCCADLEERIAELEATTVRKGNRKMSVTLSGFVGHQVIWWDDGVRSDTFIGDGGNLGSRFRFRGDAKISPTLSAGFLYEFGINNNAIQNMNQDPNGDDMPVDNSATAGVAPFLRDSTVWLRHTQLGMVKIGHGSTATDNLILIDLSGAAAAMTSDVGLWQGGFRPTLSSGAFGGANVCWAGIINGASPISATTGSCSGTSTSFDTARRNHVLYETPALHGFTLQAALAEDNFWDIALRYAGEFGGFRLAFGIGYSEDTDFSPVTAPNVSDERVMGSASLLHVATGLWVTGAFGQREIDGLNGGVTVPDATMWYIAGGIARNWTGFGNTVLFAEYSNHDDFLPQAGFSGGAKSFAAVTSSNAEHWGLGVVQHLDAAASELFLTYKNFSGDFVEGGVHSDFRDFQVVIGGMRVNF